MPALKKVFVANRGEIAVRVIRACRELGLEVVVGVSEADRESRAAQLADRSVCLGPAPSASSYLRHDLIVTAAVATGCDAVHPGYGFLSERSVFARACEDNDLIFIGPSSDVIDLMGDKLSAIGVAREAGVPVIPGSEKVSDLSQARAYADEIGYPCLIKASAGGGGRGMRVVREASELSTAFDSARQEAEAAFGDATVYVEKFIEHAKHIEVQIIGDRHGTVTHLFERDCSVQRRHQKLIEEAPSPAITPQQREQMCRSAVNLARRVGYYSAGTVEFVYDVSTGDFYFLEMNTRIQVEHPVTEMITGVDLVKEQIQIAGGEPLSFDPEKLSIRGHAIECRINAEDPSQGFRPSPGRLSAWEVPEGPGLRVDSHCYEGYLIPPFYDSMVAKLIAYGDTRPQAIDRLTDGLAQYRVSGPTTTIPLHQDVLKSDAFQGASVTTRWLETVFLPEWQAALTV